jgi:UDP-glucose 4-epimerase
LLRSEHQVRDFDLQNGPDQDIRKPLSLNGYEGVVHLAAVSRVIAGETDPLNCELTNVTALRALYESALDAKQRPWILFVSSREVYGSTGLEPVDEDTPWAPQNTYARSKVEGERLSLQAREAGLCVNIARLSSVYGSIRDHEDRVVPSFAKAAAFGGPIYVEGPECSFDFTHVDDVTRGLHSLLLETQRRKSLPTIHFVSGRSTTLQSLAEMTAEFGQARAEIREAAPRHFGVRSFAGNPARAQRELGWTARIPLESGIKQMVRDFAAADENRPK